MPRVAAPPESLWVLAYLAVLVAALLGVQALVLRAFRQPPQWTFGASSSQPRSLRLALKVLLQFCLIGSLALYPLLCGATPAGYFGPLLPRDRLHHALIGEAVALALLGLIFGIEWVCGWIYWKPRYPSGKAWAKSGLSFLSSLTVAAVEEPLFRGIILKSFLAGGMTPALALPLSAVVFSAAHFLRRVRTYWPAVGLAVLGLWLGVAFVKTGSLWLSMGLHSGGILAIGLHRCFLNYRGPAWLVGTQTFPIAGLVSILVMLAGTLVTWMLHF